LVEQKSKQTAIDDRPEPMSSPINNPAYTGQQLHQASAVTQTSAWNSLETLWHNQSLGDKHDFAEVHCVAYLLKNFLKFIISSTCNIIVQVSKNVLILGKSDT
jgi:hypothetical protein